MAVQSLCTRHYARAVATLRDDLRFFALETTKPFHFL
jgi:hypothetical protein